MGMSTLLNLAPRLSARAAAPAQRDGLAAVRHLGGATVTQLPDAATRRLRDTGIDSAIDALTCLLMQADTFGRTLHMDPATRAEFTGQVHAYATSLGVLVYPDFPGEAISVKRDIINALAVGPLEADAIRALVLPELDAPEAC